MKIFVKTIMTERVPLLRFRYSYPQNERDIHIHGHFQLAFTNRCAQVRAREYASECASMSKYVCAPMCLCCCVRICMRLYLYVWMYMLVLAHMRGCVWAYVYEQLHHPIISISSRPIAHHKENHPENTLTIWVSSYEFL